MELIKGGAGGSKTMSFGKSKARMINPGEKGRVTFNDVAGVDEEKRRARRNSRIFKKPKEIYRYGCKDTKKEYY